MAQGLGTNGLAALNLAIPIYSAITGMGMMTGMGAATCYSIMRSRGDEKADKVFTNALFIAAFFTLIFEICGIFFSGSISRLLGAEGDTYEMCRVYLRTLLIFSPFFLLNNISICFLRNDNAPHRSMAGMLAGSFSNIVLDYALQEIAIQGLKLYFIGCFFAGFNVIKAAYLSAVGISAPANLISILRGFAVIIPAALAMSALWGVDGLWLSFAASEFIVSIVSLCINPDRTRKAPSERP